MEKRIYDKMVDAMNIKDTDTLLVNFWGCEEELSDLRDFEEVLNEKEISYYTIRYTDEYIMNLIKENSEGLSAKWFENVADTTVIIDFMERPAGMPPRKLERDKYPVFGRILQELFGFMSEREKMIQITMPSKMNAEMAGIPYVDYARRVEKALDIDYIKLKEECEKEIARLSGDMRVVKTGENCELELDTTGRTWYTDAGEGAFPCGEIYIAPVEEKTNGKIYFEKLAVEQVGVFEDVTLTIKNGHFQTSDCEEFNSFMASVDEDGADIVAELGIGMNPNVTGNKGDSTIDENAYGTFHIAFGMNHMFGGKTQCRFHMDFVTKGEIV